MSDEIRPAAFEDLQKLDHAPFASIRLLELILKTIDASPTGAARVPKNGRQNLHQTLKHAAKRLKVSIRCYNLDADIMIVTRKGKWKRGTSEYDLFFAEQIKKGSNMTKIAKDWNALKKARKAEQNRKKTEISSTDNEGQS